LLLLLLNENLSGEFSLASSIDWAECFKIEGGPVVSIEPLAIKQSLRLKTVFLVTTSFRKKDKNIDIQAI